MRGQGEGNNKALCQIGIDIHVCGPVLDCSFLYIFLSCYKKSFPSLYPEVQCPPLLVAHSDTFFWNMRGEYGDEHNFRCRPGHHNAAGESVMRIGCGASGQWTPPPACDREYHCMGSATVRPRGHKERPNSTPESIEPVI